MTNDRWRFWIDVGGTFTDCIGFSPLAEKHRVKVLSSAKTKSLVRPDSPKSNIKLSGLPQLPADFWKDYQVDFFDHRGKLCQQALVANFDAESNTLQLAAPIEKIPLPDSYVEIFADEIAPLLGIRQILGIGLNEPIPACSIRLGTTRGTNALITRSGARVGFVTTRGFGDALHIGYQDRPRIFELAIQKNQPLFETAIEIDERTSVSGTVLIKPDEKRIGEQLLGLKQQGIQSLAISFLHAYRFPEHERMVAAIAQQIGFEQISLSSEVSSLAKFVSRSETTVLDAYLNPVLKDYIADFKSKLGAGTDLKLINSAGGLMGAQSFTGKDCVLSGPAGGVVGFSKTGQAAGFEKTIGFDMGGTSTDVSRFDGKYRFEHEVFKSGVRIVAPVLAIETVAAGGGSICRFDGTRLVVGPESAGSDPGPASYGRGGPLTVTDINLFLGRLLPGQFPFPLNRQVVQSLLEETVRQIKQSQNIAYTIEELAAGFLKIANANMASAIRTISVAEGFNPADFTLVAFGGAAPQHACSVALELGIGRVLIHPDAGILSALGIGLSDVRRQAATGFYEPLVINSLSKIAAELEQLTRSLTSEMLTEGVAEQQIEHKYSLELRYLGTEAFLTLEVDRADFAELHREKTVVQELSDRFRKLHLKRYGYAQDRELEIVAVNGIAVARGSHDVETAARLKPNTILKDAGQTELIVESATIVATLFNRTDLQPGNIINGPAIIVDDLSTTVVDLHWQATILSGGQLLLKRAREPGAASEQIASAVGHVVASSADPTMLEVFNNHFASIARQMGVALQNTSVSVNVKERLDFSCAIFDSEGGLVVNAPHIPVHLGAMEETIRHVIRDNPNLHPGDIIVTNDPYRGGSHLPDVTVVTPVHSADGLKIRFFVASRAHHAEIGGITPGSMPPFSKTLGEEGILISNFLLGDRGQPRFEALEELLCSGPYPSRKPADNISDIQAQVAANQQGISALQDLIDEYQWPAVQAYMGFIQEAAEQKTRQAIANFPTGTYRFRDGLDNGAEICLAITINNESMHFDFGGTTPVLRDNFNANRAIVSAAVIYCLRCLINADIPLNQGVLNPVSVNLPECFLNPLPATDLAQSAAMVAGNVETSQRIVDVIFGALKVCAASQGTMNNILFGDKTFGYYETICGGAGATPNTDGADAVHTHMTNTRMTDPEILELRFPVRLLEFSIRADSGGKGTYRGGNGIVRRIEFLRELDVAILSSRRDRGPYGIQGGDAGKPGANLLFRGGSVQRLGAQDQFSAQTGDILEIKTPGGGGCSTACGKV